MKPIALAAALLLPLAGLALGIAGAQLGARGATVWRIPVGGYDPRDPVRGHFVRFRYDWQVRGPAHLCRTSCALCLEDNGRAVTVVAPGTKCPARIEPAVSRLALRYAPEFAATPLFAGAQIYISETSAPRLTKLLQDHPAVIVARLTRGGRLIPDRLEAAP